MRKLTIFYCLLTIVPAFGAITQFDTENADRDLTSQVTCLTDTPDASNATLCIGMLNFGDGVKNLDGTGGLFELTVTIGGQTVEPDPQIIYFSSAVRTAVWTSTFIVPANAEVLLKAKSPNAADTDVDITAYLYEVGSATEIATLPTAAGNADAVWDEAVADHTTETTFGGELGGLDPNVTLILADTDELQTDWADGGRLDVIQDAIKAMTDLISINTTTVSDANDANSFTLTAGEDTNDAYFEHIIMVEDADDSHAELRYIREWNATRVLLVEDPFSFTPAIGDNVWIMGTGYGGYLYEIWNKLWRLQSPVFYYQGAGTSGGGTGGAGGVTQYDSTGNDP